MIMIEIFIVIRSNPYDKGNEQVLKSLATVLWDCTTEPSSFRILAQELLQRNHNWSLPLQGTLPLLGSSDFFSFPLYDWDEVGEFIPLSNFFFLKKIFNIGHHKLFISVCPVLETYFIYTPKHSTDFQTCQIENHLIYQHSSQIPYPHTPTEPFL